MRVFFRGQLHLVRHVTQVEHQPVHKPGDAGEFTHAAAPHERVVADAAQRDFIGCPAKPVEAAQDPDDDEDRERHDHEVGQHGNPDLRRDADLIRSIPEALLAADQSWRRNSSRMSAMCGDSKVQKHWQRLSA